MGRVPDNGNEPLGRPLESPDKTLAKLPNPNDLKLMHWANAYRSGDYIARSHWSGEWYKRSLSETETHAHVVIGDQRSEVCIGAGGHVHYMDDTAPDIAWLLDDLISRKSIPG